MTLQEYAIGFIAGFTSIALLHCGARVEDEPRPLPADCTMQAENVRAQLCPAHDYGLLCTSQNPPNPDFIHCGGPDWTEGRQVTGNAWCCDGAPNYVTEKVQ